MKLDSTIELITTFTSSSLNFQVDYRLYKNERILATQSDIVNQVPLSTGPPNNVIHTIDGLTWCDEKPDPGLNIYEVRLERVRSADEPFIQIAYICYRFGLDPAKTIIGHHILDPQRKTDPQNSLSKMGKLYDQLLQDVVKEYFDCLPEEDVLMKLKNWQIDMAHRSIEIQNEKELLHDVDEWKKKVEEEPQEVINDFPWLNNLIYY
ncbi:N-acetylmuramoyl-L-alanine amidase [Chengkuizengella sediminis]|uniref:peptidoglycan recognition protein family protein n=1 Tax=Chengkuizengella sediminis TaxID=1885917 RepID=UPI00138A6A3E|nr:N-acetylmuramoyl-L-alanine amidase [Chengkuizengella sediminis]NDI35647.1 N-acetylmuramoyl-L-alanine amidase [Chengkuizengella sediminis]